MGQGGDAGAANPLQRRLTRHVMPQAFNVMGVLPQQQGCQTGVDAAGDQLVAGQMGVGAGKAITLQTVFAGDLGADHTPVRDAMGAVGNLAAGYWHVQDERFDVLNTHGAGRPQAGEKLIGEPAASNSFSSLMAKAPEAE